MVNWELFLRSQCCSFLCWKRSVTIKGDRTFFILYTSVARIRRFWLRPEKKPSFSNRVSNDKCLLKYIMSKQRSCSLFILPFLARLWHIHTKGQWNAIIRIRLSEIFIMLLLLIMQQFFYYHFYIVLKCDQRKRVYDQI